MDEASLSLFIVAMVMGLNFASVAGLVWWSSQREDRVRAAWLEAARQLGLTANRHSVDLELSGEIDGLPVTIGMVSEMVGNNEPQTRITVGGVPEGLEMRREGLFEGMKKALGATDHLIGDEAFDREFLLSGEPARIRAALGPELRDTLRRIVERDTRVIGGTVQITKSTRITSAEALVAGTRRAIELSQHLRGDGTPHLERLARHFAAEGDGAIAARHLQALLEQGHSALADRVAREGLGHADPRVCLIAARFLGDGLALRLLAFETPVIDLTLRAGAIDGLREAGVLDGPADQQALVNLLGLEGESLRRAAVAALGSFATVDVVELLSVIHEDGSRTLRAEIDAAIRAIQSRAGLAEAGAVSLVEVGASAGAVSLAQPTPLPREEGAPVQTGSASVPTPRRAREDETR